MNNSDLKYRKYGLVADMLDTERVVRNINVSEIEGFGQIRSKVLLSGEGSSRIFPAKNAIYNSRVHSYAACLISEGARQAAEYNLEGYSVFLSSNSGKTAEAVSLLLRLREKGFSDITTLSAFPDSPLVLQSPSSYVLKCGKENAVAASKSVVEQALFYDILFRSEYNAPLPDLEKLAGYVGQVLAMDIPVNISRLLADSSLVYFAGRNDGVAEELTLKTNEILRKKAVYLEGTYAVHGIEEVVGTDEVLVIVNPFKEEEKTFRRVFSENLNIPVIAIASRRTLFPTIVIPEYEGFDSFLQLCCGWNLLVEAGLLSNIDLDHPKRARKVGNEFEPDSGAGN